MSAPINVFQCDHCSQWHLRVGEVQLFTCDSEGPVKLMAKRFDRIRNSSYREGMRCMTEEIGYEGDRAKQIYEILVTGKMPSDKPPMHIN